MPEDSKRVWGYVNPDADLRIRMLAIADGSIGAVGAAALEYFFAKHHAVHNAAIAAFFGAAQRSSWPGRDARQIDTAGDSRVWAIISGPTDVRLSQLVLAYGLSLKQCYVVVTQAIYEFLQDQQEEHNRVLEKVYTGARQPSWNDIVSS